MTKELDVKAITLAGALTWAIAVFLAGIGAIFIPGWATAVNWMGQFYVGYAPTPTGSVIGFVWGFFDVGIGLYLFTRLYNYFR